MEFSRVSDREESMSGSDTITAAPRPAVTNGVIRRPSFRLSNIWKAPLHDFPIRDEILYQYLPLSPDMDVLEIGPGSGFTAFRLARQVRSMTLVDVAEESVSAVRQDLLGVSHVRCVCADLSRPGLVDTLAQGFDVVYALDVFEYVVDPEVCLRNIASVLRPGGQLFITYPNVPPPAGDGVTWFSRVEEVESLLRSAGFAEWKISAVRRRGFAGCLYGLLHETPLRFYRRLRRRSVGGLPQTYEATWAFRHGRRLARYRWVLHSHWLVLAAALKLGGDVFSTEAVSRGIVGKQLVIRAWR